MDKTRTITIDPKMFINKPFKVCPECGNENSYGVLMIGNNQYTRRCKECWHTENYKLPKLEKKVIYLDQFLISDMMKAINTRLGKSSKVNGVFLELFEKLDTLVKLQVITCPDSMFQRQESMLFQGLYKALKRMYEHLSHGNSFYDEETIRRFQLCEDFKNGLEGKKTDWSIELESDSVLMGDRNDWQDRFLVSVDTQITLDEIEGYQAGRLAVHENIKKIFENWQKEKGRSFKSYFDEIFPGYGSNMAARYSDSITRYMQASMGIKDFLPDELMSITMGEESVLITSLLDYLPEKADHSEKLKEIFVYLRSKRLSGVPFNEIYSALWAAIAYQASSGGRKNAPNIGMSNDIQMVSILLPYCNAIIVDRDMYSLLKFGPVKKIVSKYQTKILSFSNKEELFDYLEETQKSISKDHLELIKEVYGDNWVRPYFEMYEHE